MKWVKSVLVVPCVVAAAVASASSDPAAASDDLVSASSVTRLPAMGLNDSYVTVSGLSSGGYFAVQMHVAFSKTFQGAGVFAGGPFFCAGLPPGSIVTAQTTCMNKPGLIDVDALVTVTKNTALTGTIDPLSNLADDRVWLFSGTNDSVVYPEVVQKLEHYYGEFVSSPGRIGTEFSIAAEHSMPTLSYGNNCTFLGEPYINACGYDAVGPMLQHLYDQSLKTPSEEALKGTGTGTYVEFGQTEFLDIGWTMETAAMYKSGILYVPKECESSTKTGLSTSKSSCRLHVAYHGCKQTIPTIGTQYYMHVSRCRSFCCPALLAVRP